MVCLLHSQFPKLDMTVLSWNNDMKNRLTLWIFCVVLTLLVREAVAEKVKIIFDSDMCGNHDDMGALAVLHSLSMSGEAEILAMMTSVDGKCWDCSPKCMMATNAYYGRSDIPVGRITKGDRHNRTSKYAHAVAEQFQPDLSQKVWDAVELYRKTLSAQPDKSVVIVTVGFLANINHLLASGPDQYSNLNGVELVRKKVIRWVAMGGKLPGGAWDTNFATDGLSKAAIDNWPNPLLVVPEKLGNNIFTGRKLVNLPVHHPVRLAYKLGSGEEPSSHNSHDAVAVLAAVRDPSLFFGIHKTGSLHFTTGWKYTWDDARENANHSYLTPKMDSQQVAEILDNLMADERRSMPSSAATKQTATSQTK